MKLDLIKEKNIINWLGCVLLSASSFIIQLDVGWLALLVPFRIQFGCIMQKSSNEHWMQMSQQQQQQAKELEINEVNCSFKELTFSCRSRKVVRVQNVVKVRASKTCWAFRPKWYYDKITSIRIVSCILTLHFGRVYWLKYRTMKHNMNFESNLLIVDVYMSKHTGIV